MYLLVVEHSLPVHEVTYTTRGLQLQPTMHTLFLLHAEVLKGTTVTSTKSLMSSVAVNEK